MIADDCDDGIAPPGGGDCGEVTLPFSIGFADQDIDDVRGDDGLGYQPWLTATRGHPHVAASPRDEDCDGGLPDYTIGVDHGNGPDYVAEVLVDRAGRVVGLVVDDPWPVVCGVPNSVLIALQAGRGFARPGENCREVPPRYMESAGRFRCVAVTFDDDCDGIDGDCDGTPPTRPCICVGACRGAAGLGDGWHCLLDATRAWCSFAPAGWAVPPARVPGACDDCRTHPTCARAGCWPE